MNLSIVASLLFGCVVVLGCSSSEGSDQSPSSGPSGTGGGTGGVAAAAGGAGPAVGESHQGTYHLGPVDWEESRFHNACAPYPADIRASMGNSLAGLSGTRIQAGQNCDACIRLKSDEGRSVVARVVTFGDTGVDDVDLSPSACQALSGQADCNVMPRHATWAFVRCPGSATLAYQFQELASAWWTSLWVRNPALPVAKVEVKSANHADWVELVIGTDGTRTDAAGFGEGRFTLRVTASDGQQLEDSFDSVPPGGVLTSSKQFK